MKKIILSLLLATTLAFSYDINFKDDTTCEVRHILLKTNPEWASKIELANKKEVFFSSPKNMFEFYFQPGRWDVFHITKEADFALLLVTDFKSKKAINAKDSYFVYGSREISPAGDDLVPFASIDDAKEFVKQKGGARILHFSEVKASLINLLNNRI